MAKGRGQLLNSFVFYFQDIQRLIRHWNLTGFKHGKDRLPTSVFAHSKMIPQSQSQIPISENESQISVPIPEIPEIPGILWLIADPWIKHKYNFVQFRLNVGVWRPCEKSKSRHYVCKATFPISPPIRGKRISQVCILLIVYRNL